MAIKPILFNTKMVRAILDGKKSCARRIIKPQWEECPNCKYVHKEYIYDELEKNVYCARCGYPLVPERRAPYQPGDTLYVRETWCEYGDLNGSDQIIDGTEKYYYRADGENPTPYNYFLVHRNGYDELRDFPAWHPSIHMPKEAARIWLKVTDVRVERLQECGKGWCLDIVKEGVVTPQDPILYINDDAFHDALREEFRQLWDSTIKKSDLDRCGWDASPWVWVIEFERCEKPEGV